MRKSYLFKTALLFVSVCLPLAALAEEEEKGVKSIYGYDSRTDYYDLHDHHQREIADSTVALISSTRVLKGRKSTYISTESFAESRNLCKGERFHDQKVAAFCSGTLIAPNMILTAGHCVTSSYECSQTRFVFGFKMTSSYSSVSTVPNSEVYACKKILTRKQDDSGADYAVLEIDRKVTGHTPVKMATRNNLSYYMSLLVFGYPSGLPLKMATGRVISTSDSDYFETTLDTFAGNSGSAVVNPQTLEIEGILVRGRPDYSYDSARGCYYATVYSESVSSGEEVTRITRVKVPSNSLPPAPKSLKLEKRGTTSIKLDWSSGGGTTQSYLLAYAKGTRAPDCRTGKNIGSDSDETVSNLKRGATYSFGLCAVGYFSDRISAQVSITVTTKSK